MASERMLASRHVATVVEPTILLGASVNDAGASMREFRELDAILLAEQGFVVSALSHIVNLDGLVAFGGHAKLARVVIVDGQNVWDLAILGLFSLEKLFVSVISAPLQRSQGHARGGCCTLVGLKFAITSLTGEVALTLVPKVRVMFN